jgi:ATP-dependent Clp protease, protease subunit
MNAQNLLNLYALNRAAPARRPLEAKATKDETTLYIYDVIVNSVAESEYFGGVAPETFARALADIKSPTINLRINSPGGSVFGARAMEQAIRNHPSRVVAHIDGYAASAASFLMLAADEVNIAPGGMVMIHKAWSMAFGNSNDMLEAAALLEKIDGTLVASYAERTRQTPEQIAQWMAAETWFTADEAVAAGLADAVSAEAADAKAMAWDLTAYGKPPETEPRQTLKPENLAALESAIAEPIHSHNEATRLALRALAKAARR